MKIYNIDIDYNEFDLIKRYEDYSREELANLPEYELKELCRQVYDFQQTIPWNEVNAIKFNKTKSQEVAVTLPKIPTQPKPFKSWLELYGHFFTFLGRAEYEPTEHKVEYTVPCTYSPDWVSPTNSKVFFESKGVIHCAEDARKYRLVKEQTGREIIFIFMFPNIELPFQKPRKDGTRQTHEEWCKKNGFEYTYMSEYNNFIRSERYREILARNN